MTLGSGSSKDATWNPATPDRVTIKINRDDTKQSLEQENQLLSFVASKGVSVLTYRDLSNDGKSGVADFLISTRLNETSDLCSEFWKAVEWYLTLPKNDKKRIHFEQSVEAIHRARTAPFDNKETFSSDHLELGVSKKRNELVVFDFNTLYLPDTKENNEIKVALEKSVLQTNLWAVGGIGSLPIV